ncbi:uncharacterized protein LOC119428497 [Nematolebias whitei]|uniref:uncharacterized protein LOC119428497 n=1 Tax=Nematolebias whitei TaxID=451745 RepID=UPI00189A7D97|nr:uncharacterized protein LOC119428497 [Nematolebias whitei]
MLYLPVRKHYEWQLRSGTQWLRVDNDHVIESHYCQPGAKGITINTSQGQVFIDFDKLQINNPALRVQRLSLLPQGLTEDVGWYYRDDCLWHEYGAQSSSRSASSVSSRDVEGHFALNPRGSLHFTVGSAGYSLDFSSMTQTNLATGLCRNVRRRPKFTSDSAGLYSSSPAQLSDQSFKWEFMGDEGQWTEYQARTCSFDSAAIERDYQQNQQGQLHFRINRFSYTLDLSSPRWQFLDVDGTWNDYTKGRRLCSVSSSDIELEYQQNSSGSVTFTTKRFSYELDFPSWTQRNLSTNTSRPVRRLVQ